MKILVCLSIICLFQSVASANFQKAKLIAVSNVSVDTMTGCGVPDPNGRPCKMPDTTEVSFTVPFGGPCHSYQAAITRSGSNNSLSIYDYALINCTRPEIENFSARIPVNNPRGRGTLKLLNPIHVNIHIRP